MTLCLLSESKTSENGFSLVQVLVATAVIGITSLGIATMITNMQKSMALVEAKQDVIILVDEIRQVVSVPELCSRAVGVDQKFSLDAAQGLGLTFKMTLPNGLSISEGSVLNEYGLRVDELIADNAVPMGNSSGNDRYLVSLKGRFTTTRVQNPPAQSRRNIASVIVVVDPAGKVIECHGPEVPATHVVGSGGQGHCDSFLSQKAKDSLMAEKAKICTKLRYPTSVTSPEVECTPEVRVAAAYVSRPRLRNRGSGTLEDGRLDLVPVDPRLSGGCYGFNITLPAAFQNLYSQEECLALPALNDGTPTSTAAGPNVHGLNPELSIRCDDGKLEMPVAAEREYNDSGSQ